MESCTCLTAARGLRGNVEATAAVAAAVARRKTMPADGLNTEAASWPGGVYITSAQLWGHVEWLTWIVCQHMDYMQQLPPVSRDGGVRCRCGCVVYPAQQNPTNTVQLESACPTATSQTGPDDGKWQSWPKTMRMTSQKLSHGQSNGSTPRSSFSALSDDNDEYDMQDGSDDEDTHRYDASVYGLQRDGCVAAAPAASGSSFGGPSKEQKETQRLQAAAKGAAPKARRQAAACVAIAAQDVAIAVDLGKRSRANRERLMGYGQPQNNAAGISAAQFGQLPPASESAKKNVHPDAQGCRSTGGKEHVTQVIIGTGSAGGDEVAVTEQAETYEQLMERLREVVGRPQPFCAKVPDEQHAGSSIYTDREAVPLGGCTKLGRPHPTRGAAESV